MAAAETRHISVTLQVAPCPDGSPRGPDGSCPPAAIATGSTAPAAVLAAAPAPKAEVTAGAVAPLPRAAEASRLRPWGYAAIGTGAVLLIGGAIAWEVAGSKFSSTQDACDRGCTAQSRSAGISSIQTWDTLSDVGLIAGGVLVAGGVVLFLLSPSTENGAPPRVSFGVNPAHGGSLLLGGAF
jgi:hypothetical protein